MIYIRRLFLFFTSLKPSPLPLPHPVILSLSKYQQQQQPHYYINAAVVINQRGRFLRIFLKSNTYRLLVSIYVYLTRSALDCCAGEKGGRPCATAYINNYRPHLAVLYIEQKKACAHGSLSLFLGVLTTFAQRFERRHHNNVNIVSN